MKKLLLVMVAVLVILAPLGSEAVDRVSRKERIARAVSSGLNAVCKSILPLRGILIKSEASDHINRGDCRSSGYSLICGPSCVPFPAKFYYSNGTYAGSVGYYGVWSRSHGGNGKARAYGCSGGAAAHNASSIARTARGLKTGSLLYIQADKAGNKCYSFNATGRNSTGWY